MSDFTCDQTTRRDALKRKLDRMYPKSGLRRKILNLFYFENTRWTWQTVLGFFVCGIPQLVLLLLCICVLPVLLPLASLACVLVWAIEKKDDLLMWFSDQALARYRRVLRDYNDLVASGNTEPPEA